MPGNLHDGAGGDLHQPSHYRPYQTHDGRELLRHALHHLHPTRHASHRDELHVDPTRPPKQQILTVTGLAYSQVLLGRPGKNWKIMETYMVAPVTIIVV